MASRKQWSEIVPDIFIEIINCLGLQDIFRASAVCKKWQSIIIKNRSIWRPRSQRFPWLMLSRVLEPQSCIFCDFTDTKSRFKFNLPNLESHVLLGTPEGYIISVDEAARFHATNLLTGSHRLLPSPYPLLVLGEHNWCYSGYITDLRVVLSPPSQGSIAVLLYDHRRCLAVAHEADASWTVIKTHYFCIADAIFCKGLLYAVSWTGRLVAFDVVNRSARSGPVSYLAKTCVAISTSIEKIESIYLVESMCGAHLFLIARCYSAIRTCHFYVFKLDQVDCQWTEIKSFGDDDVAVLVGFNSAAMVLTRDSSKSIFKRNCIYFSDDYEFRLVGEPAKFGMGVFSLEHGTVTPSDASDDDIKCFRISPQTWFDDVIY